jgi:hypothetical protein
MNNLSEMDFHTLLAEIYRVNTNEKGRSISIGIYEDVTFDGHILLGKPRGTETVYLGNTLEIYDEFGEEYFLTNKQEQVIQKLLSTTSIDNDSEIEED